MPGDGIRVRIAGRLARTDFGRRALAEKATLAALRVRPTPRARLGLALVALSYLIGWPAVGIFAWMAYHLREPLILAVGGPVTYGLSHLTFMVGSWLAGSRYVVIFLRWAVRKAIEKIGGAPPLSIP